MLLCLAPLAVIPGGENRFVFAKLAFFAAAVAVACVAVPTGRLPGAIAWLLVSGIALTALSAGLGSHPSTAVVGVAPRYEGLPVLCLYAASGWAGARLLGPDARQDSLRTVVLALTLTAVAIAFIAALEAAGLRPFSSNIARPGSLLGNASDEGALGALIAGTLGCVAFRRVGGRTQVGAAAVGAAAASIIVALSASRAALLGLAVVGVLLAVATPGGRRIWLLAVAIAVVVVTLVVPASRGRVTGSAPLATETVHGRMLLWQETLGLIGHHPVIGIGPGGYADAITSEHNLQWQEQVGPANPPDSPHSWVLQVGSVGGIGLVAVAASICVWTGLVGRRLVKSGDAGDTRLALGAGAFAGLVGYGVALTFGFTTPGTTPLAAALGGMVLSEPLRSRTAPAAVIDRVRARGHWLIAGGAVAMVAVAVIGSVAEIQLRQALDAVSSIDISAADAHFKTAADLRPWDPAIDAGAAHAFVVLAQSGPPDDQPAAVREAGYWLAEAGRALAQNEQVQLDEASLAEIHSKYAVAAALLNTVLSRDRYNPAVLLRLGVVQGEQGRLSQAASTFMEVTRIQPASPDPWVDLATVYELEGRRDLSALASATARRLSR